MAKMMKIESIVDRVIRSWLNELYMSGLDKMTILRMFPIKPMMPEKQIIQVLSEMMLHHLAHQ